MFGFKRNQRQAKSFAPGVSMPLCRVEVLERRQLLSGGHFHDSFGRHGHRGGGGGSGSSLVDNGQTIQLGTLAGATVGNGAAIVAELDKLAGATLASTQVVTLGNSNGVETYSVSVNGTGSHSVYTVDENADPVTAPTQSTTTFGALSSTVSTEISSVVTALSLTAPTSTTNVNVSTPTTGPAVYTIHLAGTGAGRHAQRGVTLSVDANGNVVGNISLPFAALPSAIQSALTAAAPAGSTAPIDIYVQTVDGVTLYSATFTSSGTRTTVTVNESGTLTSQPSVSTVTTLPTAADTELTALATADGGTLPTSFKAYTEPNGTTVYSADVALTGTSKKGTTYTYDVTLSVDENGNATVPANDDGGFGGGGGGGGGGGDGFGGHSHRH
jgi:hypothetical protein